MTIECEAKLYRRLKVELAKQGRTLRDWFESSAKKEVKGKRL